MNLESFLSALDAPDRSRMPDGLAAELQVLWLDRCGDWDGAHCIAQDQPDPNGAWLHAYLHRREGDESNAAYWYRRAHKPVAEGSLDEEWLDLVRQFAGESI